MYIIYIFTRLITLVQITQSYLYEKNHSNYNLPIYFLRL